MSWVASVCVNDLDRAADALGVSPDILLRTLFCSLYDAKNIRSDAVT